MEATAQMPLYECHKKVWALKIAHVEDNRDAGADGGLLHINDGHFAPVQVDAAYLAKHNPEAGGYYVVYADGYRSYSPAVAFEAGYTLIKKG